ncbi:hypothetical protein MUK42_36868 [Musa troglodytarum]|uniref:Uncharacterized protein n=1 Tax=Musa troglodytarum TaxID=320322 RepID=A0A9E7FRB3_9LILI|nr:hypothetical protein MUK42_36868 [Musa troglodytarum]
MASSNNVVKETVFEASEQRTHWNSEIQSKQLLFKN